MMVQKHWLTAEGEKEAIVQSPSPNAREVIDPDYLIIHYTAGDTARAAIDWFMNTKDNPDKIAAHLVIDLEGTITQLVPFNCRANHAGSSVWDGVENFNFHSIGIELVNPGFCEQLSDGTFRRKVTDTKFQSYPQTRAKDIRQTTHKHRFWTAPDHKHWFMFPQAQLAALYQVSNVLLQHYELITALGHEDISPLRKPDPGPCFPWKEFKRQVLGKDDPVGDIYVVNTEEANFRVDHSTNSAVIKKLSKGYNVGLIETFGAWNKVYLAHEKNELMQDKRCVKTIGWMHSSLMEAKEH